MLSPIKLSKCNDRELSLNRLHADTINNETHETMEYNSAVKTWAAKSVLQTNFQRLRESMQVQVHIKIRNSLHLSGAVTNNSVFDTLSDTCSVEPSIGR